MDKIMGIYCIENLINHKKYVGLSKDCVKRWYDHRTKSEHSTKEDDLRKPLYMAMRKYGKNNFSFFILEECEEKELKEKEIYWIDKLNTYHNGYNATLGGDLAEGHILKGEEHGMHKLTLKDVEFCRKSYSEGKRSSDIWNQYYKNVITFSGFQRMWHGKTWKDVMPEVFLKTPHPKRKIDIDTIKKIKHMYVNGMSCAEIFHFFEEKISRTSINDICNGKRYREIN